MEREIGYHPSHSLFTSCKSGYVLTRLLICNHDSRGNIFNCALSTLCPALAEEVASKETEDEAYKCNVKQSSSVNNTTNRIRRNENYIVFTLLDWRP